MKHIYLLFFFCLFATVSSFATQPEHPKRTPEEEAHKQTGMLVRELDLNDSVQIRAIYQIHLKYALLRQQGSSRKEDLERMQQLFDDLKGVLNEQQYDAFMNRQFTPGPRKPQPCVGTIHCPSRGEHNENKNCPPAATTNK